MTGLRISAEQIALRWRPALRQAGGFKTQPFTAQVRQYLLNHQRIFDAGDDFHAAAANIANFERRQAALLNTGDYSTAK